MARDGVTLEYNIDGQVYSNPREFFRALRVSIQTVQLEAAAKYVIHFAQQIYAQLVQLSPVSTGRLRRGWRVEWRIIDHEGGVITVSNPDAWYWVVVDRGQYIDQAIEMARRHTLSAFNLRLDGRIPALKGVVSG